MGKNVLVFSGSPRKGGNSDILCDHFIKGSVEAGHKTEKIYIADKKINYCIGCGICKKNEGKCIHNDDMTEIIDKMISADIIVLATPVYFYTMAAPMKLFIDRTYSRYPLIKNKELYLILTGAANEKKYMETAIAGLRGYIKCLPDGKEKGIIYGINAVVAGDINNSSVMFEAYEMGKTV